MPRFQILGSLALTALSAVIAATPVHASTNPADFSQIDTNADGLINFSEFAAFSESHGQSRTQAAQIFIDLANGDVLISKKEYVSGDRVSDRPTWERGYALPALETDVELVEPALMGTGPFGSVPAQGQIIEVTPNEEVAGEVIRTFEDERQNGDIILSSNDYR
ncbi:hypothetical protein GCM10009069_15020 [Algimonas arctica]|uniref:EF-hand domain-containing protein n=1 Tax=Algimonas arctica TaxID=1479486 RepID=A0A8J3CQ45_9PROT|nr:hypothetical protein [Algimonas arctica]GHA92969.1 hypothetical protein GCM10009069_15020 [Algimonas arctica]